MTSQPQPTLYETVNPTLSRPVLPLPLSDLAAWCDGQIVGDKSHQITHISGLDNVGHGKKHGGLVFIEHSKLLAQVQPDIAYIIKPEWAESVSCGITHENPKQAFRLILQKLYGQIPDYRIADDATIAETANVGQAVSIGHHSVIEADAVIGDACIIGHGCFIGKNVVLGRGTRVANHVSIHDDCTIGEECVIADGVVIGGQGFGFSFEGGAWEAIPQIGRVVIGDRVHIGNNSCIDRGAIGDTVIENNVIIDNLVHIAHNVRVGAHTAMAAGVGIAGSTTIGKYCLLAGQVGVVGHIEIADGVQVNGGARVLKSIKKPGAYAGSFHALSATRWNRLMIYFSKLDNLFRKR